MRLKIILIIILLITVFIQCMYIFGNPSHISEKENRTLAVFSELKINEFFSGSFQEKLEETFKDQFFQRDIMIGAVNTVTGISRQYYNAVFDILKNKKLQQNTKLTEHIGVASSEVNSSDTKSVSVCESEKPIANPASLQQEKFTHWLKPVGNIYSVDGTDILTIYPFLENSEYKEAVTMKTNQIKEMMIRHPGLKAYVYFITKPEDLDWFDQSEGIKAFDYAAYIESNLPEGVSFGKLEINGIEDMYEWLNKTDHHWNHKGAYKGYTDIYRMISSDFQLSEMKEPIRELDFNKLQWIGSHGKKAGVSVKPDVFRVYEYNLGPFEAYLGNVKDDMGLSSNYKEGRINRDIDLDQYSTFYGNGEASNLVKYVFPNNESNLLLITDSNNRPIRRVLASHFNITIVVDYMMLKEVNIDELIEENEIDAVVFAAQNRYWTDENAERINDGVKYLFRYYPIIKTTR